jgi:hypothetical protein
MSDTSYTPLANPDLSTIDPATIGVDSSITTQAINAKLSPFSVDSNNTLNINKVANFASDITVGGVINNTDLQNKLSNKSSKISTAPATIVLGQSSDFVYFVNENSVSYPLVSSNDISFSRNNNNILLNITQTFKDLYVTTASLTSTLLSYVTTASLTSTLSAYQTIAGMASYVTSTSLTSTLLAYQTIAGMASYVTSSSLTSTLTSYATLASPTFTGTVSGITKSMVGLGNVDNTSDASKPVSTATQTSIKSKSLI